MAEYYDNETLYDKPQLKFLQRIDGFSEEELESIAFKVECKCEDIDPEHPNAPKMLKRIKRHNKWKNKIWPTIRNTCDWWLMMYCFFAAGRNFANDLPWWTVAITLIGGIGWFNIFLTHKFGSDYID